MAARSKTIGNAICTWLNDGSSRNWTLTGWTAARNYTPKKKFEDLDNAIAVELTLVAIGPNEFSEPGTRGSKTTIYEYQLAVRHRYTTPGDVPESWWDDRQELVEDMTNQLMAIVLTGMTSGTTVWCESADLEVNDYEHAIANRVFLSLISLRMREVRAR